MLESEVLFSSFEEYSYQNVNIVVYILIANFDEFRYKLVKVGDRFPPGFLEVLLGSLISPP